MRSIVLALAALSLAFQVVEQILVHVNGEILIRQQLDERVRSVLAQRQGRTIAADDIRATDAPS